MVFQIIDKNFYRYTDVYIYNKYKNSIKNLKEVREYEGEEFYIEGRKYDENGEFISIVNDKISRGDILSIVVIKENDIDLEKVLTLSEAAKKWGLSDGSTIRKAIEREKFKSTEIKHAGSVWITTYNAMERVFGEVKKNGLLIDYKEFSTILTRLTLRENQKNSVLGVYLEIKGYDAGKEVMKKSLDNRLVKFEEEFNNYVSSIIKTINDGKSVMFVTGSGENQKVINILKGKEDVMFFFDNLYEKGLLTLSRIEEIKKYYKLKKR